jgi:predicted kinase
MAKLTIMQGLPASGKSTRAAELMETSNAIRINKDLLRTMLHFDKFSGKKEGLTYEASRELARTFLKARVNVLIDDTNLNPKTVQGWKDLAKEAGAKIEYEFLYTPVEECVGRDELRDKHVGSHVIKQMALQYMNYLKDENVVICDLDGTLADVEHRRHFVSGETKDWHGFFTHMMSDPIREDVAEQVRKMCEEQNAKLILVSARPDKYRAFTEDWLRDHFKTDYELLIMRSSDDSRDDQIVKGEIYDKYFKNLHVVAVFDDRPRVILMWKEKGLNVIDVGNGVSC